MSRAPDRPSCPGELDLIGCARRGERGRRDRVGVAEAGRLIWECDALTAIDWLSDVQGNVYPGFRKDHQALALVSFPDRAAGRRWLAEVRPDVASGAEVAAFNRAFKLVCKRLGDESSALRVVSATWTNVAFSWAGLERLLGAAAVARFPAAFKSDRVPWCQERADAHALLLLASDRP